MEIENYDFDGVYESINNLPKHPGVYIVLCKKGDDPHCVLDIGETKNLQRRIKDHKSDRRGCWKEHVHGEIGFLYKWVKGGREEREEVEKELRWKFDPPCGSTAPGDLDQMIERLIDSYQSYKRKEDKYGPKGSLAIKE